MTITDLSEMLGVPVDTLYGWRHRGEGPEGYRIGRHVRNVGHGSKRQCRGGAGSYGDPAFDLAVRGAAAATYGISKAAVNALTSTLAAELAAQHRSS
jgi:NAD(P)-dependent dehydrogenase (short-subunit alcohol dehydrogenase family)